MTIHTAFASDNHYAQHMAVSIASMLLNAKTKETICVHILHENLSTEHQNNIQSLESLRENTQISFFPLGKKDFPGFPLHTGHQTIATYFRIKLPDLLPEVDKIIYLDSDIVVEGNIAKLWDMNLENHLLMAVEEPCALYKARLASLGMKSDSPYFNAGIALLDLTKMRETNFVQESKNYIQKFHKEAYYQDQDVLNALAEGNWKPLAPSWNAFFYVLSPKLWGEYLLYSQKDIQDAKVKPSIIHYNQHPKPWAQGCVDARKNIYYQYLKHTPYKSFQKPQGDALLCFRKKMFVQAKYILRSYFPWLHAWLKRTTVR